MKHQDLSHHKVLRTTSAPKGQGLLELLIAIGIISASVVGTFTLVLGTTTVSDASKSQVLAMNLAREGIEVARSIRDNNWLALDSGAIPAPADGWVEGLRKPGNDYSGIPEFNTATGTWLFDFVPVDENDLNNEKTRVYLHPTDRIYNQKQIPLGAPYVATNYKRVVTLKPICWDTTPVGRAQDSEMPPVGDGSDCSSYGPDYEQVGIEARSLVRWLDRNRTRNLTVTEKIYNWKN